MGGIGDALDWLGITDGDEGEEGTAARPSMVVGAALGKTVANQPKPVLQPVPEGLLGSMSNPIIIDMEALGVPTLGGTYASPQPPADEWEDHLAGIDRKLGDIAPWSGAGQPEERQFGVTPAPGGETPESVVIQQHLLLLQAIDPSDQFTSSSRR